MLQIESGKRSDLEQQYGVLIRAGYQFDSILILKS